MKLIYCEECQDIRKLQYDLVKCKCGRAYGWYKPNGLDAVISDTAVPLGIVNFSLRMALENRPTSGMGYEIVAFVIPEECQTIAVVAWDDV